MALTENNTSVQSLRVRIIDLPQTHEIDEFDIRKRFRLGGIYELPIQLGATLIIMGYAESVGPDLQP